METREKILEGLRQEVEAKQKKEEIKIRSAILMDFAKILAKSFGIALVILLVSVGCVAIFVEDNTWILLSITLVWGCILLIVVVGFLTRIQTWYVNRRTKNITKIEVNVEDELKKLVNSELEKLPNQIFDLEIAVNEMRTRHDLLLEIQIQKET